MICFNTYPNHYRFRNAVAVALLLTVNNSIAQTQPAPAFVDFDKLAAQPGTNIIHSKRGDEDVTELQRGGVSVQIIPTDSCGDCFCPVALADGADCIRLGFQFTPCVAARINDCAIVFIDPVAEMVLPQKLPNVFNRV